MVRFFFSKTMYLIRYRPHWVEAFSFFIPDGKLLSPPLRCGPHSSTGVFKPSMCQLTLGDVHRLETMPGSSFTHTVSSSMPRREMAEFPSMWQAHSPLLSPGGTLHLPLSWEKIPSNRGWQGHIPNFCHASYWQRCFSPTLYADQLKVHRKDDDTFLHQATSATCH